MKRQKVYYQEFTDGEGSTAAGGTATETDKGRDNVAENDAEGADTLADEADSGRTAQENAAESGADAEAQAAEAQAAEAQAAEAQAAEWRDKYLRLQAEFDNFRKRTLREKLELVENGGAEVLKAMLPVLDDMQRAAQASEKSDDIAALREGEKLVVQKFAEVLKQRGVTEIESAGAEFDPDVHEAVAKFPAPEKEMKGKVIDVVQRGYRLGDKILRYAKVVVGE